MPIPRFRTVYLPLAAILLASIACTGGSGDEQGVPYEEAAAPQPEQVESHTAGVISRVGEIRVRFVEDQVPEDAVGAELDSMPFSASPAVKGKAHWASQRELVLVPSEELTPGGAYKVTVDPTKAAGSAAPFSFDFVVMEQAYFMELSGLEAEDGDDTHQRFRGTVTTADVADAAAVEKALVAAHGKDALDVRWSHDSDGRTHGFEINNILRADKRSTLELSFDGALIGVGESREDSVPVPGLGEFSVSTIAATGGDRPSIEIRFSDGLDPAQDLRGLVQVDGVDDLDFEVDGSILRVFSPAGWASEHTVRVNPGLKNTRGVGLAEVMEELVSFAPLEPTVRFAGKGVIFPTSDGLTVPLEVVNVRGVTIEATRVYQDNVPQFLQVNDIDGSSELRRVGRVVWKQHVDLDVPTDQLNHWTRVGLDMSKLLAGDPNGLYRLKVTFDRDDILTDCPNKPEIQPAKPESDPDDWDVASGDQSYWDYWNDGMSWWEAWENRHDPCHPGFYRVMDDHDLTASRNVLVSDVGLVAKQGEDGKVLVYATNLRTADPIQAARVELLDYQLQTLGTANTDANGKATLSTDRKPFAIQVKSGTQVGWLKLDRAGSLALSHFDVSGAEVQEGLKGFFYGERGVWRPGDDIFLTFILEDEGGRLPPGHPVSFELLNAQGQLVDHQSRTDAVGGFTRFTSHTEADAPTGTYTARVHVGGATFEKPLRIETVVPNRLKIGMDFGTEIIKAPDLAIDSTLEARWLHGAIADGLKADVSVTLRSIPTRFERYAEYSFDDRSRTFESEPQDIFEGRLDSEGKVAVQASLEVGGEPPGMLNARFRTRVFEPSGAFSVDEVSIPVSPYSEYVGIKTEKGDAARGMLLTDIDHPVDIVMVDADGKPVSSGEVELRLYKISWRFWWEAGEDQLADYAGSDSYTPLQTGVVKLKEGKGTWNFQIKYPDWGRYLLVAIDQKGQHRSEKAIYVDWPGWAGRAQKDNPGGAAVLSVVSDNQKVEVGRPVTLTFPTPSGGRALVSLENGSSVLSSAWVKPTGASTTYTFTATAEMAPAIYANVTLVQPHLGGENDMPIRLFGITPVEVYDPKTHLEPVIQSADVFVPETTATVKVSEKGGRPMTYTLAMVDEGLLGLTRYKTPDPWGSFYQREALGVRTWDLYDQVAGAYGGALDTLLAIGGDGSGDDPPPAKANRFPPVVAYLGPFHLDDGQIATHQINIPAYFGEVRLMVVAGEEGAYGKADKQVTVKRPLMLLATLPRVVGPGEELALPVSVFALDEKIKDVTLSVETEGPIEVAGEGKRKLRFERIGDSLAELQLRVRDELGVARVTVTATGGGETAEQTIEIDVRHPGTRATDVVATTLEGGKTWSQELTLVGIGDTNKATLEISRVPPVDLGKRLTSLIQYPHGCVEQTTSSAFPQLYLTKLMELPPTQAAETQRNVKRAIERLRSFQVASGGFAYWPGQSEVNAWGTNYAGNFLIEAERAGYVLPTGMKGKWVKYQREAAKSWRGDQHAIDQAYRLYTLALAGQAEIGAMNRLREQKLDLQSHWRLAAAYQLAGQAEVAKKLVEGQGLTVTDYQELSGTFGSALRDEAMVLEALVLVGDQVRAAEEAVNVSKGLASGEWLSTQEIAYGLVSMARFAEVAGTSDAIDFTWSLAGSKPVQVKSSKPIVSVVLPVKAAGRPPLEVVNQGGGVLFSRAILSGLPKVGTDKAASNGLALAVSYASHEGGEVDPMALDHGTDFVATVTVTNKRAARLDELVLTEIVASGWELHDPGTDAGSYDYRDLRDDRVYTYFDLNPGESKTFKVSLNAAYRGRYYLPPVSVEAMYDATIQAREPGEWVEVRLPGQG